MLILKTAVQFEILNSMSTLQIPKSEKPQKIAFKKVEVPCIQEEVTVHLFFAYNKVFQDVEYWLWMKELEEKIIKKTSGFLRKYTTF